MKFSMERAIKHFDDNGTGLGAIILLFGLMVSGIWYNHGLYSFFA